jgi:hypothetical protein
MFRKPKEVVKVIHGRHPLNLPRLVTGPPKAPHRAQPSYETSTLRRFRLASQAKSCTNWRAPTAWWFLSECSLKRKPPRTRATRTASSCTTRLPRRNARWPHSRTCSSVTDGSRSACPKTASPRTDNSSPVSLTRREPQQPSNTSRQSPAAQRSRRRCNTSQRATRPRFDTVARASAMRQVALLSQTYRAHRAEHRPTWRTLIHTLFHLSRQCLSDPIRLALFTARRPSNISWAAPSHSRPQEFMERTRRSRSTSPHLAPRISTRWGHSLTPPR